MQLKKVAVFVFLSTWQAFVLQAARVPVEPSPCSELEEPSDSTHSLNTELEIAASGGSDGNDVVYMLEPGDHCVRNYSLVRDLVNLTFQGPAVIHCAAGIGLAFFNVSNLYFSQLTINGCGLKPEHVNSFLSVVNNFIDYFFELSNSPDQFIGTALGECTNFRMENSIISNTKGLGLLGINIVGHSSLRNVTVEQNVPRGCFSSVDFNFTTDKIGGGALFTYHDYNRSKPSESPHSPLHLEIIDSHFLKNSYCGYALYYEAYYLFDDVRGGMTDLLVGGGGGLSLILTQFDYAINVTVNGSTFRNNTALFGGGAHVQLFSAVPDSHVQFYDCVFQSNGVEESVARSIDFNIGGSALAFFRDFVQPDFSLQRISVDYTPSEFAVVNSVFRNNTAFVGTVELFSLFNFVLAQHSISNVIFDTCIFEYNIAVLGACLFVQEWKGSSVQLGTSLLLKDVQCSHNKLFRSASIQSPFQNIGIIVAISVNLTFSGNSLISHNSGTGMSVSSSNIHFLDNTTFLNNSGSYGGGLSLSGSSLIVVGQNATLAFYQNTGAVTGGAIYVSVYTSVVGSSQYNDCFLYFGAVNLYCVNLFSANCSDVTKLGAKVIFEGNQASLGSVIYGSTLNTCPWSKLFRERYAPGVDNENLLELFYENQNNFTSPFEFDSPPSQATIVSTTTTHITVEIPDGERLNSSLSIRMAPGIVYHLNVTPYDGFNHEVPTVITSKSLTPDTYSQVGNSNYHFLNYNASATDFLIYGATNQSDVSVTLFAVATYSQIDLMVEITDCPDGYYIQDNSTSCICRENLVQERFNCTEGGQILVPLGSWIGRESDGTLLFGLCPLDYCKPEISILSVIPLSSGSANSSHLYDVQCNEGYNRGGVACGSCAEGYSVVFGSNRCKKCNNNSLWLLVLFAAYGVNLMLLIVFLQFTISDGFLNGVLFFSNVLTVSYFSVSSRVSYYFALFFWLSLKVGYETCFFDGMTALASTLLHFAFPLYLYFLLLVIVLLFRWSTRFARRLTGLCRGFSPTKLFVTILIMTYSSLLETCIAVLSYTPLVDVDTNATSNRWQYDPSVAYFRGYHAALSVFSILLIVFFLIPSPFLWMFPGKVTGLVLLRRFTPLYDAVWAPLKPRYRFWVSLRLIFRAVPLIILNFLPIPINLIVLSLFLLALLYVHGVLHPFRGWAQNALDSLFQVVLISYTMFSLYFTVLDLRENAEISDVETAMRSNRMISESDETRHVLIILTAIFSYFTFVMVFVQHLFLRFPKLQEFVVCAWNAVMCERFRLKQREKCLWMTKHSSASSVSNSTDAPPVTYGSTNGDEEKRSEDIVLSDPGTREVVTFSELREPLLETSGLAEVYRVNTN